jgi:cytochrome b561
MVTIGFFGRFCGGAGRGAILNDSISQLPGVPAISSHAAVRVGHIRKISGSDMIRNTGNGWGSVTRWLHWTLALAIIAMIGFGWWMNHIPARADRFFYRSIHADIGYVILLLTLLRLLWRVVNPTPALPAETSRWQKIAAHLSHGALYLVVILVAMLGWAHSGARTPDYSDFFGLFHVPQFTAPDREAARAYEDRHILFAYVLLGLIAVHVLAALWHHFIRRDRVVARMVTDEAG